MEQRQTLDAPDGDATPRYRAFNDYYDFRSGVLGVQDATGRVDCRVIERALRDARTVLDVGCGRGMYLTALAARGKTMVGLDLSERNVALLTSRGYDVHRCDCVEDIPARFAGVDAAICAEFLEHLTPDEGRRLLQNVHGVLRDGARLVVTVRFREDLSSGTVLCPRCHEAFHVHGHVRTFSEEALRAEAEAADFRRVAHYVVRPTRKLGLFRLLPFSLYLRHNARRARRHGRLIGLFEKIPAQRSW